MFGHMYVFHYGLITVVCVGKWLSCLQYLTSTFNTKSCSENKNMIELIYIHDVSIKKPFINRYMQTMLNSFSDTVNSTQFVASFVL